MASVLRTKRRWTVSSPRRRGENLVCKAFCRKLCQDLGIVYKRERQKRAGVYEEQGEEDNDSSAGGIASSSKK